MNLIGELNFWKNKNYGQKKDKLLGAGFEGKIFGANMARFEWKIFDIKMVGFKKKIVGAQNDWF